MKDLKDMVERLGPERVLVYGDVMLDEYLFGRAERLSPERPVPVVRYERVDRYLGGAGNVARNLAALGCTPVLVAALGDDETGRACRAEIEAAGFPLEGLVEEPGRVTPRKLRVHAGQHALARIDYEAPRATGDATEDRLVEALRRLAPGCAAAVASDYAKGGVTARGVSALAEALADAPLVVDPKGTAADRYRGATVLLPNESELDALLGRPWDADGAEEIRRRLDLAALVVTRSERGVTVFDGGAPRDHAARAREVFDVTGAGDTFAATFAAVLASGGGVENAARLANVAAGVKVRKVGTATVSRTEIADELARDGAREKRVDRRQAREHAAARRGRGEKVVFTNGCFDLLHAGHIKFLEASRERGDCLFVGLNTDASVRRLKGDDRPILDESERAEILSALSCVDYVVPFDEDTPLALIEAIRPDVLTKGADYEIDEIVGADFVRAYGGRVERVELVAGKSTTGIVHRISRLSES